MHLRQAQADRRRQAVEQVQTVMEVSERRVCRVLGQPRSTQRYQKRMVEDEEVLTARMVALASEYGRYTCTCSAGASVAIGVSPPCCARKAGGSITNEWSDCGDEKGSRVPRRGKVPAKQPKRSRLWLSDGSIVRLRAEFPKHVWSYDFMEDRTHNGVKFRILNVIDEFTRECLAVQVGRSLTHQTVIEVLTKLFCERGVPVHIRSDNGSEFTAKRVRAWLKHLQVKPLFIEPGSPWENGYIESFNGKMRDELLAREIFYSLKEAQILIEMWRRHYNTIRPHSALGYRPPTPAAFVASSVQSTSAGLTM